MLAGHLKLNCNCQMRLLLVYFATLSLSRSLSLALSPSIGSFAQYSWYATQFYMQQKNHSVDRIFCVIFILLFENKEEKTRFFFQRFRVEIFGCFVSVHSKPNINNLRMRCDIYLNLFSPNYPEPRKKVFTSLTLFVLSEMQAIKMFWVNSQNESITSQLKRATYTNFPLFGRWRVIEIALKCRQDAWNRETGNDLIHGIQKRHFKLIFNKKNVNHLISHCLFDGFFFFCCDVIHHKWFPHCKLTVT